jgi:hypothetical protein
MRSRTWISVLAVLGVLLHAGAIARHNAAMAGAALDYRALLAGLTQICHGGSGTGRIDASELPYVPPPNDAQSGCPICSGLSPVLALAAPPAGLALAFAPSSPVSVREAYGVRGAENHLHPPARGPPGAG